MIIDGRDHREWFDPSAHLERHHLSSENACVAGWYVGLMWTPKYLVDVVGVSIEASGFVLLLPYILPAAGTLVGGCKLLYLVLVAIQAPCDDRRFLQDMRGLRGRVVRLPDQQGLEDQPSAQADGGDLDRQR